MDKNTTLIAVVAIALIVGFGGGYTMRGSQAPAPGNHMMSGGTMMENESMNMRDTMDGMTAGLSGKVGDEFDRAFIAEMIVHHEGAVSMAQAALASAKHQEIKTMAQAIISAQTSEIAQMKEWQKNWYSAQQ